MNAPPPTAPTERFSATVDAYAKHRPDYPASFVEWLGTLVSGRRCVDLGAGTGISSRQLAAAGWSVTAVEPNDAMRAKGQAAGGGPVWVGARAEATGLPAGSADLVIGCQAWHWFDPDAALLEVDRLRAPSGVGVAAWNVRVASGFAGAYEAALLRFSTEYATIPKPEPTLEALRSRRPAAREARFPHAQRLDRDGVIGRAWSSSYVVHGVSDRAGFDAALGAAFDAFAVDGRVELAYETVALGWR